MKFFTRQINKSRHSTQRYHAIWCNAILFLFFAIPAYAAQPQPAGTQTLTSVVGKQWPGVRFRVDFDDAAIKADSTLVITVAVSTCVSTCSDSKNFKTISTSHIKGGAGYTEKGDTTLSFPVDAGNTARLSVTHNKDLVFSMSMGAK